MNKLIGRTDEWLPERKEFGMGVYKIGEGVNSAVMDAGLW